MPLPNDLKERIYTDEEVRKIRRVLLECEPGYSGYYPNVESTEPIVVNDLVKSINRLAEAIEAYNSHMLLKDEQLLIRKKMIDKITNNQ